MSPSNAKQTASIPVMVCVSLPFPYICRAAYYLVEVEKKGRDTNKQVVKVVGDDANTRRYCVCHACCKIKSVIVHLGQR